jgi:hypothetical protein
MKIRQSTYCKFCLCVPILYPIFLLFIVTIPKLDPSAIGIVYFFSLVQGGMQYLIFLAIIFIFLKKKISWFRSYLYYIPLLYSTLSSVITAIFISLSSASEKYSFFEVCIGFFGISLLISFSYVIFLNLLEYLLFKIRILERDIVIKRTIIVLSLKYPFFHRRLKN